MFVAEEYKLLDFGDGRRLERFGPYVLDRPSAAAEGISPKDPSLWKDSDLRYDRRSDTSGVWSPAGQLPESWNLRHDRLILSLKLTPFGHLGLFPEQATNWDWIVEQVRVAPSPLKVLNLFAYTGGSTLSAVAAGAEVVHVDAAQNIVTWARRNAELSGLADATIRWITEDAAKFVRRELKRGNRYDAVILDPPAYGHGPKDEVWQMERDLEPLLSDCAQLTRGRRQFMLLVCHTAGYASGRLAQILGDALDAASGERATVRSLKIASAAGGELHCGVAARWSVSGDPD